MCRKLLSFNDLKHYKKMCCKFLQVSENFKCLIMNLLNQKKEKLANLQGYIYIYKRVIHKNRVFCKEYL